MDTEHLLKEIDTVFPSFDMPARAELTTEFPRYVESEEIRNDMEDFRGKLIDRDAVRTIHRYLPVLSAKGTRWILPWFLRYCLTDGAQKHSRIETRSIIYALSPETQFRMDTLARLSLLSKIQLMCLSHFFEWCLLDEYWINSEPERLRDGIEFLNSATSALRQSTGTTSD